jgi:SAM-dependent methyltransferase
LRQASRVDLSAVIRKRIKAGRKRGAAWVHAIDILRHTASFEGWARLWTAFVHRREVQQTSSDTSEERYPELFDLAARLAPGASRILSFGCSTGEELSALRRRFPKAEMIGVEINPRSRRAAARRMRGDRRTKVVTPTDIEGEFDLIFALAVLQREPHKIAEMGVDDLTRFYPFARFDKAVLELAKRLRRGGLLCVANAQYRVEDSTAAPLLSAVADAPKMDGLIFGPDGRRLAAAANTLFRKN